MLEDEKCDPECNNPYCNFDNGYCNEAECSKGCSVSMIGDSACQPECYVKSCEWDREDCLISNGCTPEIRAQESPICYQDPCNIEASNWHDGMCGVCNSGCYQDMLDNGTCDEACNVKACKYDNEKCFSCSLGCTDSIKGLCKSECLTASCDWDSYTAFKSCNNHTLREFYRNVQAANEDWNLIDIEEACIRKGCDLKSYLNSPQVEADLSRCNNHECGYNFGENFKHKCNERCDFCYGASNGKCLRCKSEYLQLYSFCVRVCPDSYLNVNSVCIYDDDTTEDSPANHYINANTDNIIQMVATFNNRYQIINLSRGIHNISILEPQDILYDLSYLNESSPLDKPGHDISQITIQPWMCNGSFNDKSLCYQGTLNPDQRPLMKWIKWVSLKTRRGTKIVISNINLYGKFPLISTWAYEYEDYCPDSYKSSTGIYINWRCIYPAGDIPTSDVCAKYHSVSLFEIESSSLKLRNVKISSFRMEPHAIIRAKGRSKVELENVDFDYIRVSRISGSAVIVLGDCPDEYLPYECGVLIYKNGTVFGLNDGYELEPTVQLQGLVYAEGANRIEVKNINFSYSSVYSPYDDSGMINLKSFKQIFLEDITVEYSAISKGLLNIFGDIVIGETLDKDQRIVDHWLTHVNMNNINIYNTYSRNGLLLNAIYSKDLQNINMVNIAIYSSISSSIIDIKAYSLTQEDAIGGKKDISTDLYYIDYNKNAKYLNVFNINITDSNLGQYGIIHSKFYSNIQVDSLLLDGINSNSTTYNDNIRYYYQQQQLFIRNTTIEDPQPLYLSYIDSFYSFSLNNSIIKDYESGLNYAGGFVIGEETSKWNNYVSFNNTQFIGLLSSSIESSCVLNIAVTDQLNISNSIFKDNLNLLPNSLGAVYLNGKGSAYITIKDSKFESNVGGISGGICVNSGKEVHIENVWFYDNSATSRAGGGLYLLPHESQTHNLSLQNVTFLNNRAWNYGGAISIENPYNLNGKFSIVMNLCIFENNFANLGGSSIAMMEFTYLKNDSSISNSEFRYEADSYMGSIYMLSSGAVNFDSCIFKNITSQNIAILYMQTKLNFKEDTSVRSYLSINNSHLYHNFGQSLIYLDNSNDRVELYSENNYIHNNTGSIFRLENAFLSDVSSMIAYNYAELGAGLYVNLGSYASLYRTSFNSNNVLSKGGAIYIDQNSNVTINEAWFLNNTAEVSGSAISITSSNEAISEISNSVFRYNYCTSLGTINILDSNLTLVNVTMTENTSNYNPGIILNHSAINITNSSFSMQSSPSGKFITTYQESRVYIQRCNFTDRDKLYYNGPAVSVSDSQLEINDSMFERLYVGEGSCITSMQNSSISIQRSTFSEIDGSNLFGCIQAYTGTLIIKNSLMANIHIGAVIGERLELLQIENSSFSEIYGSSSSAITCISCSDININNTSFKGCMSDQGGALNLRDPQMSLSRCSIHNSTFQYNSATYGGAIYILYVSTNISNSHFLGNQGPVQIGYLDTKGGAIYIDKLKDNSVYIKNSEFIQNNAVSEGGAIKWTEKMPKIDNQSFFSNNYALYGGDLAGIPLNLVYLANDSSVDLYSIASGQQLGYSLIFNIIDELNQTVKSDNKSICEISLDEGYITGVTKVSAVYGTCTFSNLTFVSTPPSSSVISLTNSGILTPEDKPEYKLKIPVKFRRCKSGEYMNLNRCDPCVLGTYSLDPASNCKGCPNHAKCSGQNLLMPDKGYWRSSPNDDKIFECLNKEACLEANEDHILRNCDKGYKGNLCQVCENGYARISANRCEKCSDDAIIILEQIGILIVIIAVLVIATRSNMRSAFNNSSVFSIYFKILLNYFQLMTIMRSFNFDWPKLMLDLFKITSLLDSSVDQSLSVDCLIEKSEPFYIKLVMLVILPVILTIMILSVWVMIYYLNIFRSFSRISHLKSKVIGSLTVAFFFIHPTIVRYLFAAFNCMEIQDGEYWLMANLSVRCWEGEHLRYALGCALTGILLWVIITPTLCIFFLLRNKSDLGEIEQKLKFGFLYLGFKESRFYWEFVNLFRKVLLIGFSVFLTHISIYAQALTVFITVLIYLCLQYFCRPYTLDELNNLELCSIFISAVTIYTGLYYLTLKLSNAGNILLFILLTALNLLFYILWLGKTGLMALALGYNKSARIRWLISKLHLDKLVQTQRTRIQTGRESLYLPKKSDSNTVNSVYFVSDVVYVDPNEVKSEFTQQIIRSKSNEESHVNSLRRESFVDIQVEIKSSTISYEKPEYYIRPSDINKEK